MRKLLILSGLITSVTSCGGSGFLGMGPKDASDNYSSVPAVPAPTAVPTPVPVPSPAVVPAPAPAVDRCQDMTRAVGADIVFLIDNSNSLSTSDCPSSRQTGTDRGVSLFQCGTQTNRETAVLSAFDALTQKAIKDGRDAAVSNMAVIQFPTTDNTADGSKLVTNGWLRTSPAQTDRAALAAALSFTRTPAGATPYGSAIETSTRLFSSVPTDGKNRLVILVTDGEPTDKNPASTSAKAVQLRQLGVTVFTIYVTNNQAKAQRISTETKTLTSWDQASMSKANLHWYASSYTNFNQYVTDLFGATNQASLVQKVTSPVNPQCVDAPGAICDRKIVEVADASGIAIAAQQIISTNTVSCP